MHIIFILEIIGTIAFAVSGAFVGIEKKMDVFGVAILGLVTAVGGGIMRDLLLGITPPAALQDPVFALTAIIVSLVVFSVLGHLRKFSVFCYLCIYETTPRQYENG